MDYKHEKSVEEVANEIAHAIHICANKNIDSLWELSLLVKDICFDQAARMVDAGKTSEEIKAYAKKVT